MTTTTLDRDKRRIKTPITGLMVPDEPTKEHQFYWSPSAGGDTAIVASAKAPDRQTEQVSNARLLLDLAMCVAISLYLLARSLDNWLSGPPMTARDRERFSITASDRHWKYWSRL